MSEAWETDYYAKDFPGAYAQTLQAFTQDQPRRVNFIEYSGPHVPLLSHALQGTEANRLGTLQVLEPIQGAANFVDAGTQGELISGVRGKFITYGHFSLGRHDGAVPKEQERRCTYRLAEELTNAGGFFAVEYRWEPGDREGDCLMMLPNTRRIFFDMCQFGLSGVRPSRARQVAVMQGKQQLIAGEPKYTIHIDNWFTHPCPRRDMNRFWTG